MYKQGLQQQIVINTKETVQTGIAPTSTVCYHLEGFLHTIISK